VVARGHAKEKGMRGCGIGVGDDDDGSGIWGKG